MKTINDSFLSTFAGRLAAGESRRLPITAEFIAMLEADFDLYIRFDDKGEAAKLPVGCEWRAKAGEHFSSVTVRNSSATTACTFELQYGAGGWDDRRLNVVTSRPKQYVIFQDGASIFEDTSAGVATLAAGAVSASFSGDATSTKGRRKSIIVTNLSPTNTLYIRETGSNVAIAAVFPKSLVQLFTDDTVAVENAGATSSDYIVGSIFYRH